MSHAAHLLSKFHNRQAQIAVIGFGYVGLPFAVSFAQAGYQVVGIDLDRRKVDAINQGESYIEDVPTQAVAELTFGQPERVMAGSDMLVVAKSRPSQYQPAKSTAGNRTLEQRQHGLRATTRFLNFARMRCRFDLCANPTE